jgi:Ion transport protein
MCCFVSVTGQFDLVENGMIYPCVLSNSTLLGGNICPHGYVCSEYWEGPYYGIECFDDIFLAMLTVFTVISLSGWSDVLYAVSYVLFLFFSADECLSGSNYT